MRAEYRVKDNKGRTRGFIIDGLYYGYWTVYHQLNNIENLIEVSNKIIKSRKGTLPVMSIKEAYKRSPVFKEKIKAGIFKRDIQEEINRWYYKFSTRNILRVDGARQVGKTTEILKFALKHYEQIIYINLAQKRNADYFYNTVVNSIDATLGMNEFCKGIGELSYYNTPNTVLIIDEIQANAQIYNALRELHTLGCHIIVTGSYLGRLLQSDIFQPAGDLFKIEMTAMTFNEFARVFSKEKLYNSISEKGESVKEDYITLTELYKIYLQIGGYPSVVAEYKRSKNLSNCYSLLKNLLSVFIDESVQYFKNTDKATANLILTETFRSAAIQMLKEKKGTNSFFLQELYNFIEQEKQVVITQDEMKNAFSWLINSGIIGGCDLAVNCDNLNIQSIRRAYFRDVGLLQIVCNKFGIKEMDRSGLIAETFVYNELAELYRSSENNLLGDKPCCATFDKFELDFIIFTRGDKKIGLEVKSSKGKNPVSLEFILNHKKVNKGIIAEITKGGIGEKYSRIPIYLVNRYFRKCIEEES